MLEVDPEFLSGGSVIRAARQLEDASSFEEWPIPIVDVPEIFPMLVRAPRSVLRQRMKAIRLFCGLAKKIDDLLVRQAKVIECAIDILHDTEQDGRFSLRRNSKNAIFIYSNCDRHGNVSSNAEKRMPRGGRLP